MHECRWDGCGELRGVNTGTWGSGVRFFVDVEMFDSIRLEIRGADGWSDIFSSAKKKKIVVRKSNKLRLIYWGGKVILCVYLWFDWLDEYAHNSLSNGQWLSKNEMKNHRVKLKYPLNDLNELPCSKSISLHSATWKIPAHHRIHNKFISRPQ